MAQKKTSDAQIKASRKWEQKNKKKSTIDAYRRQARNFIRNHATTDDLDELGKLITERRKSLK